MISSEEEEVFRVLDLVGQQQADCLYGFLPPVDVVAQEEIVGVRGITDLVKVPEEIAELAVDVADDVDGGLELQEHRLLKENLAGDQA